MAQKWAKIVLKNVRNIPQIGLKVSKKRSKIGLDLLRKGPKMFQKELKWSKSRSKLVETTSEKNSCKSSDQKT